MRTFRSYAVAATLLLACSGTEAGNSNGTFVEAGSMPIATADAHAADAQASVSDAAIDAPRLFGEASADGMTVCDPPDVLVVLDHTDSMSRTPSGEKPADDDAGFAETKWVLAVEAVRAMTAPPGDQGARFGLERFPEDPETLDAGTDGGACVTLPELLGGKSAKNETCQPGELLVSPGLGNGAAIAAQIQPLTTRLCNSTPIGLAIATATSVLQASATAGRSQYVVLVTDGAETCKGDPVAEVQALAAAGIETYVVGFGTEDAGSGGVNVKLLNDMACAGKTAKDFSTSCETTDAGYAPMTPNGAPLFFAAQDGPSLQAALQTIAGAVCCACAQ
jgi:hypothetical protein